MITTPTVFVLGAGASMPYGFPSGKELVQQICGASNPGDFLTYGIDQTNLKNFVTELRVSRQTSVDAFLEHRREFLDVGKKAIAYHLIRFEKEDSFFSSREDWYTYLLDKMTEATPFDQFPKNRVGFITFNYDRSLEHYLHTTLCSRYGKSPEEVAKVLHQIPIVHVHGNLGYLPWQRADKQTQRPYATITDVKSVEIAAKGIKIVSDHLDTSEDFGKAWDLMATAKRIAILGFSYHPVNMRRLKLPLKQTDKVLVVGSCKGFTLTERSRIMTANEGLNLSLQIYGTLDFLRNENKILLD